MKVLSLVDFFLFEIYKILYRLRLNLLSHVNVNVYRHMLSSVCLILIREDVLGCLLGDKKKLVSLYGDL